MCPKVNAAQGSSIVSSIIRVGLGGTLRGDITVPGDKSISHRAVLLGSLATGTTEISGLLESEDVQATITALKSTGASITGPKDGRLRIDGIGPQGLNVSTDRLHLGNSGTSMRLLSGLLAARPLSTTLTGDNSLSARDMNRIAKPLRQMGANISLSPEGRPPIQIRGGQLHGIEYRSPIASAQVKSCVLLAGLQASGTTRILEPTPTRDHTERMLAAFGGEIRYDGEWISIQGGSKLQGSVIAVPGDISSAAFFMVGALIGRECDITLQNVGVNPTRTGIIDLLRRMGADLTVTDPGEIGGEPIANIRVRSSRLHGIEVPVAAVARTIDEFPILFIAAACAEGRTVVRGAAELRKKESDRIDCMAEGLETLGIEVRTTADGLDIQGGQLSGGRVHSYNDHRIAMSFVIAALAASAPIEISDNGSIATSFPNFITLAKSVGLASVYSE